MTIATPSSVLIVLCVSKANTGSIPLLTLSAVKDIVPAGAIEIKCEFLKPTSEIVWKVSEFKFLIKGALVTLLCSYKGNLPFSKANSAEYI